MANSEIYYAPTIGGALWEACDAAYAGPHATLCEALAAASQLNTVLAEHRITSVIATVCPTPDAPKRHRKGSTGWTVYPRSSTQHINTLELIERI